MVDYISTEIVAYADNTDNTLDFLYRTQAYDYQMRDSVSSATRPITDYFIVVDNMYDLPSELPDGMWGPPMTLTRWIDNYCLYFTSPNGSATNFYNDWLKNQREFPESDNLTYRVLQSVYYASNPDKYGREYQYMVYVNDSTLGQSWFRIDYYFDYVYYDIDGEFHDKTDIYWLYDLGKTLVTTNLLFNLLNINIGGTNLVTLLFGGGFILYVSWVVVKWIIPS